MNRSRRHPFRMGLAAGIPMLMLALSVAVPVLEQGALSSHVAVESEHDPGDCPSGHDHTVCTQVGANLAVEGGSVQVPETRGVHTLRHSPVDRFLAAPSADRSNPSRAPPLV